MSKAHVLTRNDKEYRVVIHFDTPPGNNSAGKSWKNCLLSSGECVSTVLSEAELPGNISSEEKASIEAGNVLEIQENILLESGGANALDQLVDTAIDSKKTALANKYKYYGYTQE